MIYTVRGTPEQRAEARLVDVWDAQGKHVDRAIELDTEAHTLLVSVPADGHPFRRDVLLDESGTRGFSWSIRGDGARRPV